MSKSRFEQVEERISQLVEGSFARLFAGRLQARDVAVHLARALEDHAFMAGGGIVFAPNLFVVRLNPDDHTAILAATPDIVDILTDTVIDFANRATMRMLDRPTIAVIEDEAVSLHSIAVDAQYEDRAMRSTQAMQPVSKPASAPANPRNPHLILNGQTYIPLDRQVLNIGRRRDNHIVLDDARVSRNHAQIRLRFGHYVLYDLGSAAGTLVNNQRIKETILKTGDVISIAGIVLVYIEDDISTGQQKIDLTKTQSGLRRTPGLKKRNDDDITL